jgi:hypothetical protein
MVYLGDTEYEGCEMVHQSSLKAGDYFVVSALDVYQTVGRSKPRTRSGDVIIQATNIKTGRFIKAIVGLGQNVPVPKIEKQRFIVS